MRAETVTRDAWETAGPVRLRAGSVTLGSVAVELLAGAVWLLGDSFG